MDKATAIDNFVDNRPNACGVFGYGSGVFKQESYSELDRPQIDLMFVVSDLKKWHLENIKNNRNDYSIIGKLHLNLGSITSIKGHNKITYVSNIKYDNYMFKYGVIEVDDFIKSLSTWDTFFVAGRFQKPTLSIKSNPTLNNVISHNVSNALLVACFLSDAETDFIKLYEIICGLSYLGDVRMAFAENPKKVQNIVKGSISNFVRMYLVEEPYITFYPTGTVIINQEELLKYVNYLPLDLLCYLAKNNTDLNNITVIKKNIYMYFREKNKQESFYQIVDGIRTNGVCKSVPYALAKINKRFKTK